MPVDAYAYRQRKYEERAQERQEAALAKAQNLASAVPEPGTPTRSFGFQSGAARVNEGQEKNLAAAGAEIGAPTSYAGGAGAPDSIGVIRGMKQTFATDTGGPQLQEFATPQQAGQAWNRNQLNQNLALAKQTPGVTPNLAALEDRYGKYVPPKGPEAEIIGEQQRLTAAAENKRPDLVALAEATKALQKDKVAEGHVGTLENYLTTTYGKQDPKSGRMVFQAADENMARDVSASEEIARQVAKQDGDGGKAAISHFQERQNIRTFLSSIKDKLPREFNVNAYLGAMAQNPEAWQELVKKGQALKTTPNQSAVPSRKWYEVAAEQHM